eukprot:c28655_g1_i1 orf=1070-4681(+)
MPLVSYVIRNEFTLANPEIYRTVAKDDSEALLEGVAMAGLVGIVRQIGDLAEFAVEVFHDLHEEVMTTAARSHELMIRLQQVEAEFPAVEKFLLAKTNQLQCAYTQGVDWHASTLLDQNHLTEGDLPGFIRNSYEECRGPPRLFMLDKFDVAGAGACLKRYTDPFFFKMEWASTELLKAEKEQRDKRSWKQKKKSWQQRNGAIKDRVFVSSMHPRMEYSYVDVENLADATGAVSQDLNAGLLLKRKTISHNSNGSPMEDSMQVTSDKTVSEYDVNLQLQIDGGISSVSNLKPLKVGDGDMEAETRLKLVKRAEKNVAEEEYRPLGDVLGDDIASDTEQFVDALAMMESEVETDTESKTKPDLDSDSFLEAREGDGSVHWNSEDNEVLQEQACQMERAHGHSFHTKMELLSVHPATEINEQFEKRETALVSTSHSESGPSSFSLDENHSFLACDENSLSPSLDKGDAVLSLHTPPVLDEKHLSHDGGNSFPSVDGNKVSPCLDENNDSLFLDKQKVSSSLNVCPSGSLSSFPDSYIEVRETDGMLHSSHSISEDNVVLKEHVCETQQSQEQVIGIELNLVPETVETFERNESALSHTDSSNTGTSLSSLDETNAFHKLDENILPPSLHKGGVLSSFNKSDGFPSFDENTVSPPLTEDNYLLSVDDNNLYSICDNGIPSLGEQRGLPPLNENYAIVESNISSVCDKEDASSSLGGGDHFHDENAIVSVLDDCIVNGEEDPKSEILKWNGNGDIQLEDISSLDLLSVSDIPLANGNQNGISGRPGSLAWHRRGSSSDTIMKARGSFVHVKDNREEFESKLTTTLNELSSCSLESMIEEKQLTMDCSMLPDESMDDEDDMVAMMQVSSSSSSRSSTVSTPKQSILPAIDFHSYSETEPKSLLSSQLSSESSHTSPIFSALHSPPSPVKPLSDFGLILESQIQGLYSDALTPSSPILHPMVGPDELSSSLDSPVLRPMAKIEDLPLPTNTVDSCAKSNEFPLVANSPLLSPMARSEDLPPPPPLPPLQWRMRTSHNLPSSSSEIMDPFEPVSGSLCSPTNSQFPALHVPAVPSSRSEMVSQDPPSLDVGSSASIIEVPASQDPPASKALASLGRKDSLIEAITAQNRGLLKVTDRNRSPRVKPLDDRETLLQQIRTQSFSLRHTVVEKHEIPRPVSNINVAAILEKANAIRQAFAGSDEDSDDDWSDA